MLQYPHRHKTITGNRNMTSFETVLGTTITVGIPTQRRKNLGVLLLVMEPSGNTVTFKLQGHQERKDCVPVFFLPLYIGCSTSDKEKYFCMVRIQLEPERFLFLPFPLKTGPYGLELIWHFGTYLVKNTQLSLGGPHIKAHEI